MTRVVTKTAASTTRASAPAFAHTEARLGRARSAPAPTMPPGAEGLGVRPTALRCRPVGITHIAEDDPLALATPSGRLVARPDRRPAARRGRRARAGAVGWPRPRTGPGRPPPRDDRTPGLAGRTAVDRTQAVGRGHDRLGAGVLEHPELPVEVGDRADLTDALRASLHQAGGQDHNPCRRNDDHKDHGHQLLDLRSVQKNPNHRQFGSGGWSGNDRADIGRARPPQWHPSCVGNRFYTDPRWSSTRRQRPR